MLILPSCTFIQKTTDYRRCPRDPGGITFWRPCLEVAGVVITPIWFWIPALYYSMFVTRHHSERIRHFAVHRVFRLPLASRYADVTI